MRRCGALFALCLGLSAAASAAARDADARVDVGGRTRTFSVHVPASPAPEGGFPVILAFHGGGGDGAKMRRLTRFDALADARGFIAVYPDGVDKHWNDGRATIRNPQDDVGFVAALLDDLGKHYAIDAARVYATGLSNGALFTQRLGCDLSARIAAIAPVAGSLPRDLEPACRPKRGVALLQVGGTADPIMPFGGGAVADFGGRGEGGNVLSAAATAAFWARRNGCAARTTEQALPPSAPLDPTRVVRQRYLDCPPAGAVTLLTVAGGGHTWPGGMQYAPRNVVGATSRQIDASRVIVDFFLAQPAH